MIFYINIITSIQFKFYKKNSIHISMYPIFKSYLSKPNYIMQITFNRSDWIRTSDPYVPNVVLYQTEPRFVIHFIYTIPFFRKSRCDWIRTSDLSVPNAALYQAEPRIVTCGSMRMFISASTISYYTGISLKYQALFAQNTPF